MQEKEIIEEKTELENQSLVVCAWRLDTKISAEDYVDALDKLIDLAKLEGRKQLAEEIIKDISARRIKHPEIVYLYLTDVIGVIKEKLQKEVEK